MKIINKINQYLNENKIIKVKLYQNTTDFDVLYTVTDGKGNFVLTNDKSVYFDTKKGFKQDKLNKPNAKNIEYDVMEYNNVLGIYDTNMKLIKKFKNMKDLEDNIDEFLEKNKIELIGWE